jgi:aryl-alcohol dehydrogenase-like predicted oxidoreductase
LTLHNLFGKTDFYNHRIGLGTWQLGGVWGSSFDHKLAEQVLHTAVENGVNFIDTADVYSMGLSEEAIGKFLKTEARDSIFVASKCGRLFNPHTAQAYTLPVLKKMIEDSLKRLQIDCLDLIQLHCPPTDVYYMPELFYGFETLKKEGKIKNLGVSVEKVEEALKAIQYENVVSVQIIFNMFRMRPSEDFFRQAKEKNVAIIARVPLASGLLSGKFGINTMFGKEDHRFFNRNGERFDKGETFSGIPYDTGLEAVNELKEVLSGKNLAKASLAWVLQHPEVSVVIPGASSVDQVHQNMQILEEDLINENQLKEIKAIYNKYFSKTIHHMW